MGRPKSTGEDAAPMRDGHRPRRVGEEDLSLGQRIRVRRSELGMSQQDLATALGLSFQQVQKYEKGKNRVGATRLQEIANALKMPVNQFYGGSKNKRAGETLISHDPKYNLRLLRAYNAIPDIILKRKLVTLMERMAGITEGTDE